MSGQFMSVTDLAAAQGVSKQAISKQLSRCAGQIPTRKDGVRLLVDVEAYDRLTGGNTDPAQALRNRDVRPSAQVAAAPAPAGAPARTPTSQAQTVYSIQRAKREGFDAELARIALEKEMGKLVPVKEVEDAMVECAMKLTRIIEQLPSKSEDPAVKAILKQVGTDLRSALHESMKLTRDEAEEEYSGAALEDAGA